MSLLKKAKNIAVLTGAGISTPSGIRDYRGSEGLWTSGEFESEDEITRAGLLKSPQLRKHLYEAWRASRDGRYSPNGAHWALRVAQIEGRVGPIVTQNVDGLHEYTGSDTIALHGSLAKPPRCWSCDTPAPVAAYTGPDSRCWAANCTASDDESYLYPGVVLFDDYLDSADVDRAVEAFSGVDAVLVIGTTLQVTTPAHLVEEAFYDKIPVVVVNQGPTMADSMAAEIHYIDVLEIASLLW